MAALGDTVAVSVTLVPIVVEVDEAASVVVVVVLEDELLPLPDPHPAISSTVESTLKMETKMRTDFNIHDLAS